MSTIYVNHKELLNIRHALRLLGALEVKRVDGQMVDHFLGQPIRENDSLANGQVDHE